MKVQCFKHNFTLVANPLEHNNIKTWDYFFSLEICPLETPKAHFLSFFYFLKFAQKKKKAVK
jgi:hypothetical protein